MKPDKKAICCNFIEATKTASEGTLAYVIDLNQDNACERVFLSYQSRGGRWIEKWESLKRLANFRFKTIPESHPKYDNDLDYSTHEYEPDALDRINSLCH